MVGGWGVAPFPPPQLVFCANVLCSHRVDSAPSLCTRCHALLPVIPSEDALRGMYSRVVEEGCGVGVGCRNPICTLAAPNPPLVNWLVGQAPDLYYLCITDDRRVSFPPLPPALAAGAKKRGGAGGRGSSSTSAPFRGGGNKGRGAVAGATW